MGETALALDGGVAIHAIGDRANDLVLDIYEQLVTRGADGSRLRIEHASLLTGPAVERMARLGITASVQPAFLASEGDWLPRRLGDNRMAMVYPFRTLSEAGVTLLGGSDTPVETPDPNVGIEAAIGRHGINPSEALDRASAESMFAAPT
jgi:predicted amidohydrolase YtcJ